MYLGPLQYPCWVLRALLSSLPMKGVLVFRLYWFQNSSVFSVGVGGDKHDTEELDEDENLVLKEFLDNS